MIVMFRTTAIAAVAALTLGGCAASTASPDDGRLHVVAAFYPLAYAVEQVGGDRVTVASLTKPGGEPHDLELLPRQILDLQQADVTVYLAHFQPAVDAAVAAHAEQSAFDVTEAADLMTLEQDHADHGASEDGDHADADHGDADHGDADHGHDHGGTDPHFWLDPIRYGDVATAIAAQLTAADPAGATAYQAGAQAFTKRQADLDEAYRSGLSGCRSTRVVTGHAAFGYLTTRYGLEEEAVSGLSPDQEPTAASMAHVVDFVRDNDIRTVYAETLASPALTETLARETGARVSVLDPVEGITDESAGPDYFAVMQANLTNLRAGQECS